MRTRRPGGLRGLRARTALSYGLGALLVTATMAVLAFVIARGYLIGQRERSATRQTFVNARLVRDEVGDPAADISGLLASLRPDGRSEVAVSAGGEWYTTSIALTRASVPDDVMALLAEGKVARRWHGAEGDASLVIGVPLATADALYVEVFALDELQRTLDALRTALALAALLATLGGAGVGLLASRRVLRPLHQVATTASEIGAGDLDRRLPLDDPDLRPLADAFNRMVAGLQERIRREARFSSDVSHELRTPLAAMTAAMSIARRRADGVPPSVSHALDVVDEQIEAFESLTGDLLEIARVDAGSAVLHLDEVDPVELVRQVVDQSGRGVPVEVEGHPDVVRVDKRRIRQVLMNLLVNAERYAGGAEAVRVTEAPTAVRVRVEDRGPGVPPEEREAIFGRFARGRAAAVESTVRGSGLGLALAREHAELHGGRLWVEGRSGGGAAFVLEIPSVGGEL